MNSTDTCRYSVPGACVIRSELGTSGITLRIAGFPWSDTKSPATNLAGWPEASVFGGAASMRRSFSMDGCKTGSSLP